MKLCSRSFIMSDISNYIPGLTMQSNLWLELRGKPFGRTSLHLSADSLGKQCCGKMNIPKTASASLFIFVSKKENASNLIKSSGPNLWCHIKIWYLIINGKNRFIYIVLLFITFTCTIIHLPKFDLFYNTSTFSAP